MQIYLAGKIDKNDWRHSIVAGLRGALYEQFYDSPRELAARIRDAAAIGNVEALDAIAGELSASGDAPGSIGRRIATLTAAFDYDALLQLADSLEPPPR